jgi:hypothetical protein
VNIRIFEQQKLQKASYESEKILSRINMGVKKSIMHISELKKYFRRSAPENVRPK